ncbi:hypothetical protein [Raoultella ornithinolytica]|uniref:hypothetical protein n=1 Tax=Raoultella ornithinolytica TaxID=54291 RepID=UPI002D7FA187|nr:hypothetical protein [Raoultella ornithinolytica]MEB4602847.1 hypothetical protein [Raoultella ornithinolytica]
MPENITFRTQLIGGVTEFCQESNLPFLSNAIHLVELIVRLAHYREEGVSLFPKVYLTNDKNTLMAMLPGGEILKIGGGAPDINGIENALKKCAPLATNGWMVYIEASTSHLEYGLFKGPGNPISVVVDDVLMTESAGLFVVKTSQVADDCVEIQSNSGGRHFIFLNHRKENSPPPLQYISQLIESITKEVPEEVKEPTLSFLSRLFINALRESHGCIIAVTNMKRPPKYLSSDGVILENPIDFADLVINFKKERIEASHLESKGHLLKGMLNSDGIILFDNKGRLLGYNCFIKLTQSTKVIGGARKRAYSGIKSKVGRGLAAVFMQSQDGWTDFKGINNE